ncbi:MAG TPA: zinc ribbon domain-containing protein [Thermoplasmata archaeon]|nr:zinc ribbon domain-containing protein [Thermoplasmata archaeon]
MDPEDEAPERPEIPAPTAPPKPELRIRDLTDRPRGCNVCGKAKPAFIEIEVDGVLEYTCQGCYEGQVIELTACRKCGAAMEPADHFCGKCGTPRLMACASCGNELDEEDRFCGKCGTKVT